MRWRFDDLASTTYPLYSRAVVGELCPGPVTPLTATAGICGVLGPALAQTYAQTGLRVIGEERIDPDHVPVAMFSSYIYVNTALLQLFGGYASGADPAAFARLYLGDRLDLPAPLDSGSTAEQIQRWIGAVLGEQDSQIGPEQSAACYRLTAHRAAKLRTERPELAGCDDQTLAERILGLRGELHNALRLYTHAGLASLVAQDLLGRAARDAGHPGPSGELVAGTSGTITEALASAWTAAAEIRASPRLRRQFDQDVDSLAAALDLPGESTLRSAIQPLASAYGHVGPAEWELSSETWGTEPRSLFAVLEVFRRAETDPTPLRRTQCTAELSARRAAGVRTSLRGSPTALRHFDATLRAATEWLRTRQASRQVVSALHHEQRLAARQLGRRHRASGLLDTEDQIFMLLAPELRQFAAEPARLAESLRMRSYDYHALAGYRPPFVTIGQPPPAVRWTKVMPARARKGWRELSGTAAARGTAGGPARVLRSPADSIQVRPGDVLVLPTAGPYWAPLLPVAAAVVVDAGAPMSDVAVGCRDLGVPCVVTTIEASSRISNGVGLEVDGCAGKVRAVDHTDSPISENPSDR